MIIADTSDKAALNNLNDIIKSGRIPHSFLIEGSTKEKRKEWALYLAKSILCLSDNKPCGLCTQCKTVESNSNPDITFVLPQNDKKFISVDRIRQLRQEAFVMPHSAEKRVFVIEDALLLNEQGQNALLKILEEPPKTVVFILLVSSRTGLLSTVVSRCSIFHLSGTEKVDDDFSADAKKFLSFLFDSKEYEMLMLSRKYEKDRTEAQKFLEAVKSECLSGLKSNNISNYRAKILSRIFDTVDSYNELIVTNVNMTLLFTAMVGKFKSFIK